MEKHKLLIRQEQPGDIDAIQQVNELAFGQPTEAEIVDCLRQSDADIVSLVAVQDEQIVGHILFSPITIEADISKGGMATRSLAMQNEAKQTVSNKSNAKLGPMGLAPMAVLPNNQRQGIGSKLIEAGLEELKKRNCPLVIVLGYPGYYPKFGFEPASRFGLQCQWEVPDEAFMALLLNPDLPTPIHAIAKYRSEFDIAM
jgi:putative acetyltransferase